jgi:hypothetical protein
MRVLLFLEVAMGIQYAVNKRCMTQEWSVSEARIGEKADPKCGHNVSAVVAEESRQIW